MQVKLCELYQCLVIKIKISIINVIFVFIHGCSLYDGQGSFKWTENVTTE